MPANLLGQLFMIDQSDFPRAGVLRRLGALIYDGLLAMAISMAYGGLTVYLRYGVLGETLAAGEKAQSGTPEFVGMVIVVSVFFCFFWRRAGQTLGMRAWRLRLQQKDGGLPSWKQCILRAAIAPYSIAFFGIGYLWCLIDKEGDAAHDKLGGLQVVVLPKGH